MTEFIMQHNYHWLKNVAIFVTDSENKKFKCHLNVLYTFSEQALFM